jgi:hypothetical protein
MCELHIDEEGLVKLMRIYPKKHGCGREEGKVKLDIKLLGYLKIVTVLNSDFLAVYYKLRHLEFFVGSL